MLRDYFLGLVDESLLSEDLIESGVKTSYNVTSHYISDDLTADFEVTANHLIRLCDGFSTGKLKAADLELIAFALETSEHFVWDKAGDDSPIARTIQAWASPEINYPLTGETIAKFKYLLLTGENLFTRGDVS